MVSYCAYHRFHLTPLSSTCVSWMHVFSVILFSCLFFGFWCRAPNPDTFLIIHTPLGVFSAKSLAQNKKRSGSRLISSSRTKVEEVTAVESTEIEPFSAARCRVFKRLSNNKKVPYTYLFLFDSAYLSFFFFQWWYNKWISMGQFPCKFYCWQSFLVSFIVDIVAQDAFWLHGLFVLWVFCGGLGLIRELMLGELCRYCQANCPSTNLFLTFFFISRHHFCQRDDWCLF